MEKSFSNHYGSKINKEIINLEDMKQNKDVIENYERLKSWDWIFG